MKPAKTKDTVKLIFGKKNYILMIIGIVFLISGYLTMGFSDKANFGFNFATLTVAPILIMLGFIIEFFAIMYKEKK